eukprot:UN02721
MIIYLCKYFVDEYHHNLVSYILVYAFNLRCNIKNSPYLTPLFPTSFDNNRYPFLYCRNPLSFCF